MCLMTTKPSPGLNLLSNLMASTSASQVENASSILVTGSNIEIFENVPLAKSSLRNLAITRSTCYSQVGRLPTRHHRSELGRSLGRSGLEDSSRIPHLSLIHISEPTRQAEISYAVFC